MLDPSDVVGIVKEVLAKRIGSVVNRGDSLRELLEPSVLQGVLGRDALVRVLLEHERAQVQRFRAQLFPQLLREVHFALFVAPQDVAVVSGVEDEFGGQQDVHDDAKTEDVGLATVAKVVQDLRSNVAWRAATSVQWLIVFDYGGETKVNDDEGIQVLVAEYEVLRLQVAMHNVVRMQHNESIKDASQNSCCILLLVLTTLLDLIEELLAIQVFNDQVNVVVRLEDLVELQHVWVPNLSEEIDLVVQAQDALDVILKHRFLDGLESKLALLCGMRGLKDLGEVAFSDDLANLVVASHVDEHAKVLHELEPFFDVVLISLLQVGVDAVREHDHFVQESDNDALLEVEASRALSVPAAEDHRLRLFLEGNELNLAVFDVQGFAACFVAVATLELVELAFEEDEEPLLLWLHGVLLKEADVEQIADVLELGNGLLGRQDDLANVQVSLQNGPAADWSVRLALRDRLDRLRLLLLLLLIIARHRGRLKEMLSRVILRLGIEARADRANIAHLLLGRVLVVRVHRYLAWPIHLAVDVSYGGSTQGHRREGTILNVSHRCWRQLQRPARHLRRGDVLRHVALLEDLVSRAESPIPGEDFVDDAVRLVHDG